VQIKQDILSEISRKTERGMERLLCEKELGWMELNEDRVQSWTLV
jgi:hypothetical protein